MAEDMLLFWASGSPPCWRVMIALEEKNLQEVHGEVLVFGCLMLNSLQCCILGRKESCSKSVFTLGHSVSSFTPIFTLCSPAELLDPEPAAEPTDLYCRPKNSFTAPT
uniref:Uncharacterized protein n=1 Tax=Astyanax mexicanus TaxID=7994 RepID=A0A8B9HUN2_ASTMX